MPTSSVEASPKFQCCPVIPSIVTSGWKKGVYLPEVATETGWDAKTFFLSCATEKAGLTEAEAANARIEVFQTEGFEEEGYS